MSLSGICQRNWCLSVTAHSIPCFIWSSPLVLLMSIFLCQDPIHSELLIATSWLWQFLSFSQPEQFGGILIWQSAECYSVWVCVMFLLMTTLGCGSWEKKLQQWSVFLSPPHPGDMIVTSMSHHSPEIFIFWVEWSEVVFVIFSDCRVLCMWHCGLIFTELQPQHLLPQLFFF